MKPLALQRPWPARTRELFHFQQHGLEGRIQASISSELHHCASANVNFSPTVNWSSLFLPEESMCGTSKQEQSRQKWASCSVFSVPWLKHLLLSHRIYFRCQAHLKREAQKRCWNHVMATVCGKFCSRPASEKTGQTGGRKEKQRSPTLRAKPGWKHLTRQVNFLKKSSGSN